MSQREAWPELFEDRDPPGGIVRAPPRPGRYRLDSGETWTFTARQRRRTVQVLYELGAAAVRSFDDVAEVEVRLPVIADRARRARRLAKERG